MERVKRQRMSAEAMRMLLAHFARSGLAVPAFCRCEGSASCFYRGRADLGAAVDREEVARVPMSGAPGTAAFVDLGTLPAVERAADGAPGSGGDNALAVGQSPLAQIKTSQAVGRLVIDLPRTLRSTPSSRGDIASRDGDRLMVPKFR